MYKSIKNNLNSLRDSVKKIEKSCTTSINNLNGLRNSVKKSKKNVQNQ